jgi:hypothetical protein
MFQRVIEEDRQQAVNRRPIGMSQRRESAAFGLEVDSLFVRNRIANGVDLAQ